VQHRRDAAAYDHADDEIIHSLGPKTSHHVQRQTLPSARSDRSTGANTNALTAGSVDIWLTYNLET
jgi:hypothetical protein